MKREFEIRTDLIKMTVDKRLLLDYDEKTGNRHFYYTLDMPVISDIHKNQVEVMLLFVFSECQYHVYNVVSNTLNHKTNYKAVLRDSKEVQILPFIQNSNRFFSYSSFDLALVDKEFCFEKINLGEPYTKFTSELNNIDCYLLNCKINLSGINVLEDYFVILHKEARINPNYIVGFLSYEKKIVKVDKEKFGIFSPRENEVYKVGKMLTGLKEDERIKVTDITITGFFHRVGEIAKIEDFLEKYKMSVDYPTTDTNNIDPLKINFEEYFLIGFSGSKLVRVNGKIVKQIKGRINNFKFEIDNFEDSIKLVNMRYIGNSLVRIRRTDKVTSFHEVKSFGYFRTEEKFRELIKKKKAGEIKDIASHLYNSSDDSNYQNISNLQSKDQSLLNVLIENETVTDRGEDFSYYYNEGTTPVGYENYENPDDPELEDFFNLMLEDNTFACEDNDYIKIEDDYRNNIFFETWISINYDGIIYNSMDFKTDLFYLDYSKVDFDIKKISDSKLEILGNLYTRFISKITASDNA